MMSIARCTDCMFLGLLFMIYSSRYIVHNVCLFLGFLCVFHKKKYFHDIIVFEIALSFPFFYYKPTKQCCQIIIVDDI